jgi:hypothetical protein
MFPPWVFVVIGKVLCPRRKLPKEIRYPQENVQKYIFEFIDSIVLERIGYN